MEPFRRMFSRPVRSPWNPVPTSSSAASATVDLHAPRRRVGDFGQKLEKRALAGAVAADDAEHLAFFDFQADVLDRPDSSLVFWRRGAREALQPVDEPLMEQVGLCLHRAGTVWTDARTTIECGHVVTGLQSTRRCRRTPVRTSGNTRRRRQKRQTSRPTETPRSCQSIGFAGTSEAGSASMMPLSGFKATSRR